MFEDILNSTIIKNLNNDVNEISPIITKLEERYRQYVYRSITDQSIKYNINYFNKLNYFLLI